MTEDIFITDTFVKRHVISHCTDILSFATLMHTLRFLLRAGIGRCPGDRSLSWQGKI